MVNEKNDTLLLTTQQGADLLGVSMTAFKEIMKRGGNAPIELGRGRGRGLRWLRSSVIKALHVVQAKAVESSAKAHVPKKRSATHGILDRPIAELFAEFSAQTPTQ